MASTKKKPPAKSATKAPAKGARRTSPAKPSARSRPKAEPKARPGRASVAKAPAKRPARAHATGDFGLDKLQQIALTATNLDASVVFYRDTLGMKFVTRFDPPGLAFFNLGGGVRLLLSATASSASLYFHVDDLEAAIKELRKRGVQFLQPPHMIHRDEAGDFGKRGTEEWMAFFHDPGGNLLALVERR